MIILRDQSDPVTLFLKIKMLSFRENGSFIAVYCSGFAHVQFSWEIEYTICNNVSKSCVMLHKLREPQIYVEDMFSTFKLKICAIKLVLREIF